MRLIIIVLIILFPFKSFCWGFYAHKMINEYAVFLLPPEMMVLYKKNIGFLKSHAIDPDKRKSVVKGEASKHFIDIDHYGDYPFEKLPHRWSDASIKFSTDTLRKYGIVPWEIKQAYHGLTESFKTKDLKRILKNSADIGHYIADAHVPLHTNSNHNGQLTDQVGIHGFWESRIPELLSEKNFNFYLGSAKYIEDINKFIWERVLESAAAADTVLKMEKQLSDITPGIKKYAFEKRSGKLVKQYSTFYTIAYNNKLNGMVERRMRQSISSIASIWMTAWIAAGQPDLNVLAHQDLTADDKKEFEQLDAYWKKFNFGRGDNCE